MSDHFQIKTNLLSIKRNFWHLMGAVLLGFFWAYSFTTRIGLLFIIPLWLKLVVLLGLSLNLSILGFYLSKMFWGELKSNRLWLWVLIAAIALSMLVFILIPYKGVPFRTTHTLEIEALESEVTLKAIYSPDDNLMSRNEFTFSDDVLPFDEAGFRLIPGSKIHYQRAHTGKLTLLLLNDSGPVSIYWDGLQETITSQVEQEEVNRSLGRIKIDRDSDITLVTLPGNMWGKPDPLWTIFGALLPISDFLTLVTLTASFGWIAIGIWRRAHRVIIQWGLVKVWADGLICVGFAAVMIRVGFPEFAPYWFLFFFATAMFYLLYQQIHFLTGKTFNDMETFVRIRQFLQRLGNLLGRINQKPWVFLTLIVIIALVSSMIQLKLTSPGMGISGDSVHYLEGAKNLADGKGYVLDIVEGNPVPITGFEPLYSTLLSIGTLLGMEVQQFARYLNTFLVFLTLLMVGWVIFKTTGKVLPAVIGTSFLLLSPLTLNIYAWAMSEPAFIVLILTTLLVWSWHISNPSIWRALLTGVSASLMINTRVAGLVFLLTFVLLTLLVEKNKFIIKIRNAFVMGVAGIVPYAAFFIRNQIVSKSSPSPGNSVLGTFPKEYWETIGQEVSSWFKWQNYFNYLHQRYNALFISLGVVVLIVILWLIFRKKLLKSDQTDPITIFIIVSIPIYLIAIILNTVFLTADPTASGLIRYLIPIFLLLTILISKLFSTYWKQPFLFQKLIILFIVLTSLLIYFTDAAKIIRDQPVLYRNYTDRKNQCGDEIVDIINQTPEKSYYTNNCEYFFFMSGHQCRNLTHDEDAYHADGDIFQAVKNGAVVVFSDGFGTNLPTVQPFIEELSFYDSACYLNFYRWPDGEK